MLKEPVEDKNEKNFSLQMVFPEGLVKILDDLAAEDFSTKGELVKKLILKERERRFLLPTDPMALSTLSAQDGCSKETVINRLIVTEYGRRKNIGWDMEIEPVQAPPKVLYPQLEVTEPKRGDVCYFDVPILIRWRGAFIKDHSYLWIKMCFANGAIASDSFMVPNTGKYDWILETGAEGKYFLQLSTSGEGYIKRSGVFEIKKHRRPK